jgi:hypothetical protein
MKVYPGSCPLGGGSLYPVSNLVYVTMVFTRSRRRRSGVSNDACNVICPSGGAPCGFIYAAS